MATTREVIRDARRTMEERKQLMDVLRAHLAQGERQAKAGEFVSDFSMDGLIDELDKRA